MAGEPWEEVPPEAEPAASPKASVRWLLWLFAPIVLACGLVAFTQHRAGSAPSASAAGLALGGPFALTAPDARAQAVAPSLEGGFANATWPEDR